MKWHGGQVVRRQSAKLLYAGSIPARASFVIIDLLNFYITQKIEKISDARRSTNKDRDVLQCTLRDL